MSFSSEIKSEISKTLLNEVENRNLLLGYLFVNGNIENDRVSIVLENMSVARKIFKTLKYSYKMEIKMTVRMQKKFAMKQIFIFEVIDKEHIFKMELANLDLSDKESLSSFIKGIFLACGSISNPAKRGYHLELLLNDEASANKILKILNYLGYSFKMLMRNRGYMLYLKNSEEISDFIKLMGAVNSLFYYEDIRIYRDHKNMVNRLNNCEQANFEKSLKTSEKQLMVINYLRDNNYFSLLDDKTIEIALLRLKYPEESFQKLADILNERGTKKVSKSYINHHFRKMNEIYERIRKKR